MKVGEKESFALTNRVRELVLKMGAQKVGVASAELYDRYAPEGYRMRDLLPGATCAIVFIRRMHDTVFNYLPERTEDYTQQFMYLMGQMVAIEMRLTEFLSHEEGWQALPVIGMGIITHLQKGPISLKHLAVFAGLGSFGLHNLLTNRDFGARQRIGAVLTDAPLTPDEPVPMKSPECEATIARCRYACVRGCPAAALSRKGHEFMDKWACYQYYFLLPCPALYQETGRNYRCGLCIANCPIGEKVNWRGWTLDPEGRKRRSLALTSLPLEERARRMAVYYNRRRVMPELAVALDRRERVRVPCELDLPGNQHMSPGF